MPYNHGIHNTEITTGARPTAEASTAVIGIVATASDAVAESFPLDTPVLFTDIYAAIGKAGVAGTLSKVLTAIAQQVNPIIVVVRVAEGVGEDADADTETNVIGTVTVDGQKTGLKALLSAKAVTGYTPKIIGAPGLDTAAVTAELAAIAIKLDASCYAKADGATITEAAAYRDTFSQRELTLIWPEFTDFDGSAVARALGVRALLDRKVGWHTSLSNNAIQGVTGITKPVSFDISGESTDAQVLNDGDITTLVRENGFRFWGNRTCSDDPIFAFESVVRSGQTVRQIIRDSLVWAIDKPLTAALAKDIVETGNNAGSKEVAAGRLIGFEMWFDPAKNSASALAAGKLVISYKYTPCAPLENLGIEQMITDEYYDDRFAQQIAA
ncbi:phage tail sheath subtilisin-like domain-containing protein [Asticcacaulis taihuensis]|uniref:phage tail sheath subtilisin-like domain-containing protein n=1 Tax=Asticcacaulis taihuensis TaxID=260084 RepID=UPI0026EC3167|nr:phage tail sheath subtilisin-like domain-containing protein [Asticcacaulis taihuensis]